MELTETLKEAIAWRIRVRDGEGEDWDAFVQWLEGDASRSDAYDRVALLDQSLDASIDELTIALLGLVKAQPLAPWRPRGLWLAGFAALAAMILAMIGVAPFLFPGQDLYEVATTAGEQKLVAIEDSGTIALNGNTRILLDRRNPRYAELLTGEAAFTIRHDRANPFEVISGADRVRDLGTVFNVLRDAERFEVEVAVGRVLYNPGRENVSLGAGQTLRSRRSAPAIVEDKDPATMSGWSRGQLTYSNAPLEDVVRDIARKLGRPVELDPSLTGRAFAGSVRVDGEGDAVVANFAAALELQSRRTQFGWTIEPAKRAPR